MGETKTITLDEAAVEAIDGAMTKLCADELDRQCRDLAGIVAARVQDMLEDGADRDEARGRTALALCTARCVMSLMADALAFTAANVKGAFEVALGGGAGDLGSRAYARAFSGVADKLCVSFMEALSDLSDGPTDDDRAKAGELCSKAEEDAAGEPGADDLKELLGLLSELLERM